MVVVTAEIYTLQRESIAVYNSGSTAIEYTAVHRGTFRRELNVKTDVNAVYIVFIHILRNQKAVGSITEAAIFVIKKLKSVFLKFAFGYL